MARDVWTQEDQNRWDYLSSKGYDSRDADEEMAYESLKSKREICRMNKESEMEKKGPLYMPAIIVLVMGIGSCTGGIAAKSGELIVLGVILFFGSSFLNWLNSKIVGTE